MRTATTFAVAVFALGATLTAQWGPSQPAAPPSPRSEALLFYDLFNQQTLLFGGNWTDDFWSLTNNTWTQLTTTVKPPARRRGAIGVNTFNGEAILYGGQDSGGTGGNGTRDDTWIWNGITWQNMQPAVSPGGLMWHAMAYDDTRDVTVAYGGRRNIWNNNEYLGETWEYNRSLNQWTNMGPLNTPGQMLRPAMCYHPVLQQIILFGGELDTGLGSDATWTYDGIDWTQTNQTGTKPPPRMGAQMLANYNGNVVVLFGGRDPVTFNILNDTWEHDGVQWREVSNVYGGIYPPRTDFAMAHDLVNDRLISFGGKIANNGLRNDTWEYGAHWQPFGLGCAGSAGTPTFTPGALPRLGQTATADIGNVPPSIPFAFMAVGLSRTQWALGNLPALLTGIGMPGCRSYTSADLLVYVPATAGVATWSWNVPSQAIFLGEPFYLQGITFDPGINTMGLAVSPAATLVVGN